MAAAASLVRQPGPHVWLLSGHLGAGKTTFVRGALRALGIRHRILSPTFSLRRAYAVPPGRPWSTVVHVDGYRLSHPREYPALDVTNAMSDSRTLLIIEWPERFVGIRWGPTRRIRLLRLGSGRRLLVR